MTDGRRHTRLPDTLSLRGFDVTQNWVTRFRIDGTTVGGAVDLTHDERFAAWFGTGVSVEGKRVLELGPLEGAHTIALCEAGAREVVSVEGRAENFVKCCVVKNALSLERATFVFDDIRNVTRDVYGAFDAVLACGVLYHQSNPMHVLTQLADISDTVMLWTHIATGHYPRSKTAEITFGERRYRGRWYREPDSNLAGLEARSFWPYVEDLRRMFADAGFRRVDEVAINLNHPQGADWLGTLWRESVDGGR